MHEKPREKGLPGSGRCKISVSQKGREVISSPSDYADGKSGQNGSTKDR
jgi:hypothetical protein